MFYAEEDDEDFDSDDRDDPCIQVEGFNIPAEKKEKFSLILEDINLRMTGQAFKVWDVILDFNREIKFVVGCFVFGPNLTAIAIAKVASAPDR